MSSIPVIQIFHICLPIQDNEGLDDMIWEHLSDMPVWIQKQIDFRQHSCMPP